MASCGHKAALRITRGLRSRFPQQKSERNQRKFIEQVVLWLFGLPFDSLDIMKIAHFIQSVVLITSITCNKLPIEAESTTASYDPGVLLSKIFNLHESTQGKSINRFRFEDQYDPSFYNYANAEIEENPIYSSSANNVNHQNGYNDYIETYADDNRDGRGQKKRKRKQKYQRPQVYDQYMGPHGMRLPQAAIRDVGTDYQGLIYRPTEPPKASFASEALSTVTEALTSMALYDDLQCVPRLLCEAASGGAVGSSQTLQSVSGLQPLLTLLSGYSGVSSNPLFVFGRAAFLGISSKNNLASCRYAYPLCPTDPEKLVYYLNNHNGGFFRFFNSPQRGQHNIGQFYDELSQKYGNPQHVSTFQHKNGAVNNLYQPYQQNLNPDYNLENYGLNYPYKQDKYGLLNNIRFENHDSNEKFRVEKRIQNRPEKYLDSDEDINFDDVNYQSTKWYFPKTDNFVKGDNYRVGKGLKFPDNVNNENNEDSLKRDPRGFIFPDSTTYEYLNFNRYQPTNQSPHNQNHYDNLYKYTNIYKEHDIDPDEYTKDQSIRTVYVVRGNGDPRHPEIVKLRPGQSVH